MLFIQIQQWKFLSSIYNLSNTPIKADPRFYKKIRLFTNIVAFGADNFNYKRERTYHGGSLRRTLLKWTIKRRLIASIKMDWRIWFVVGDNTISIGLYSRYSRLLFIMAGGCFPGHNISIFILWITATSEIVRKRYCVPLLPTQPSAMGQQLGYLLELLMVRTRNHLIINECMSPRKPGSGWGHFIGTWPQRYIR